MKNNSKFLLMKEGQFNGFQMTFENGYMISVQFSTINYSDGKTTAEVAAFDADGNWLKLSEYDNVIGYQTTNEVADIIEKVKSFKSK